MLFNFILAGAVLLSTVAYGRGVNGSCFYPDKIPKKYDYPYTGKLKLTIDKNLPHCGTSQWRWGTCVIVVHPENIKQNIRHEMAHCNGWKDHY